MVRPWKARLNDNMVSGGAPGGLLTSADCFSSSVGGLSPRSRR